MCVLSTLCGNVDKHSPFDIYIYLECSKSLLKKAHIDIKDITNNDILDICWSLGIDK